MAMAVGSKGSSMCDMNVTPLIDVLLVLLIIFLIITPHKPHGLHALVPQPPPPNQPPPPPSQNPAVEVAVAKDHSLTINTKPVTWGNLPKQLQDIFKTRAQKVLFVKGDPDVDFRYVAEVMDVAKGAGLKTVGVITPKVEAGQ
ncbi:MAG: ExbD/TolR family protein [Bryobacteraceae bacterium]